MIIYLKHPVHGTKVAVSDMEARYDMSNGWKVFDPNEETEAPKKRGRPKKEAEE